MKVKDWIPSDFLLALFLCMAFIVVVGYGIFIFGGMDVKHLENVVKIGVILMLAGICVAATGFAIALACQICNQESLNKNMENPTIVLKVDDGCSCPRTVKVTIMEVLPAEDK